MKCWQHCTLHSQLFTLGIAWLRGSPLSAAAQHHEESIVLHIACLGKEHVLLSHHHEVKIL